MPQTFQPKLASVNKLDTESLSSCEEVYTRTGGAIAVNRTANPILTSTLREVCTKVKGVASTPTKNAKEKLSVARVASDMPRTKSEKDLIS